MSGTVTASTATAANAATANRRLTGDFNTFLTLLTTQLQNQSPTDPLDTNQMTNQLVQFASVEQQIAMNQNLERLISMQQASQVTAAAPLIGQRAEVESDRLALQNGQAELRLPAAGTARTAQVRVLDGTGRTVRSETVTLGTGATSWTWNGKDSLGRTLADGAYRVQVTGRGANGEEAPITFTVAGTITGAERVNNEMTLSMGGMNVGFDSLRRLLPGN
ncbi:hypothetical protein GWK16_11595 [Roseomonas sp. JC162]|uniref:Basal-body rod modification protein FlgD n=1 Tax=Neoroseomonas marina TaxID=1232220 RepID=A0A848EEH1_9PROT|nr:flagellar hook capping FlgD N-terminal domain-containing protein [Neoroseomonas marina]NMJ41887.1 hypothetical protein [Neoroseomonas marina]